MAKRTYLEFVQEVFDRAGERSVTGTLTTLVGANHIVNQVATAVNSAYMQIAAEKAWWWLQDSSRVRLLAPYETGTITATADSDTITGDSTVWLTNARAGDLFQISGQTEIYEIATVPLDTSLTLTTNVITAAAAGTAYKIVRPSYDLPATYKTMRNWARDLKTQSRVEAVDWADFQLLRKSLINIGDPYAYTIYGNRTESGTTYQQIWPIGQPSTARDLELYYKVAATKLSSDADTSLIPEEFEEALIYGALGTYYKFIADDARFSIVEQEFVKWMSLMFRQQSRAESQNFRIAPDMSARTMSIRMFTRTNEAARFINQGGLG